MIDLDVGVFWDSDRSRECDSRAARAHKAAFCWMFRCARRCERPLLNTAAVTRATWAMVARGAVSGLRWAIGLAMMDCCFLGERAGEDMNGFSLRGVLDGLGDAAGVRFCSEFVKERWVSDSIRSIARRQIANALRRSPVWAATFLERNIIAVGWMNGAKSGVAECSAGRRDLSLVLMISVMSATVYGMNEIGCGFKFFDLRRGRNRSVISRALAMPTRTKEDVFCIDHSKS